MTMVLPCRLITRHRSHMGLTEARTFISSTLSVGDSTASEVIRRQLHLHLVARKDADVVLSHLPGDLRQHLVPVVQPDAEHRARKRLGDLAFDLDLVFLLRQLPRRNRASSARFVGTRKNTARAAARHGSKPASAGRFAVVSTWGPSSVTATVCSKCAEREPSADEIDHSSACITTSGPPALIIGSIASVIPGSSSGPRPGAPKFGICGSSW